MSSPVDMLVEGDVRARPPSDGVGVPALEVQHQFLDLALAAVVRWVMSYSTVHMPHTDRFSVCYLSLVYMISAQQRVRWRVTIFPTRLRHSVIGCLKNPACPKTVSVRNVACSPPRRRANVGQMLRGWPRNTRGGSSIASRNSVGPRSTRQRRHGTRCGDGTAFAC